MTHSYSNSDDHVHQLKGHNINKKVGGNLKSSAHIEYSFELMTVGQAAGMVKGLSSYAVRKLCNEGIIPCRKIGKKILITKKDFYSWLLDE